MKKLTLLTAVIFVFLIMSGCNTDDEKVSQAPEDVPVEENEMNNKADTNEDEEPPFTFTSFDLDVEYAENIEFDVDYENERDGMDAEIKNDKDNSRLLGDEAFAELRPIFEQFTFDQNTAEDEVFAQVRDGFSIEDDFQSLELEITYLDGSKKEYYMRQ